MCAVIIFGTCAGVASHAVSSTQTTMVTRWQIMAGTTEMKVLSFVTTFRIASAVETTAGQLSPFIHSTFKKCI